MKLHRLSILMWVALTACLAVQGAIQVSGPTVWTIVQVGNLALYVYLYFAFYARKGKRKNEQS